VIRELKEETRGKNSLLYLPLQVLLGHFGVSKVFMDSIPRFAFRQLRFVQHFVKFLVERLQKLVSIQHRHRREGGSMCWGENNAHRVHCVHLVGHPVHEFLQILMLTRLHNGF
jgi:hypothetical protein